MAASLRRGCPFAQRAIAHHNGAMISFDEAQKALEGMAIRRLSNDFEGTLPITTTSEEPNRSGIERKLITVTAATCFHSLMCGPPRKR